MIQNFQMPPAVPALPWPVLWAPVISAAGVILVGFVAAYIAWRQMVTARTKVQADLYALRLPVYQTARRVLLRALDGTIKDSDMMKLMAVRAESAFLFDDEMATYLHLLVPAISEHKQWVAGYYADDGPVPPDPFRADENAESMWERVIDLDRQFMPYLRLEQRDNKVWKSVGRVVYDATRKVLAGLLD